MDSESACARVPVAPRSSAAGPRAATNSLPRHGFTPLRSSSRFSTIYRTGSRSRKGGLQVLRAPGSEAHTKVGVVAGRKVGNAVHRNRAKRRMREAVRRVELPAGFDYILVASVSVNDASFDSLVGWLAEAVEAIEMKTERNQA